MEPLSEAARKQLETTYTRGVSRFIDKKRRTPVRAMWVGAFLMCLGMLAYHTQFLFAAYLLFDYTTATQEVKSDLNAYNQVREWR